MKPDFLVNLTAQKPFLESRGRLLSCIRAFFEMRGYLEIETPIWISAPAPEAYIEAPAVCGGGFLRTSPELQMKIMLAAGYEKMYQVGSCFREGERGRRHRPEFTMLEWYEANGTYGGILEFTAALLIYLGERMPAAGVDFKGYTQMTVRDAFMKYANADADALMRSGDFETVLVEKVEPNLGVGAPLFLTDYPADAAAFARLKSDDPTVAERFELYVNGVELANAYGELTDPDVQLERFEAFDLIRRRNGGKPYPPADDFLAAIRSGIPSSAGCALGVDRLAMLFSGAQDIGQVRAF